MSVTYVHATSTPAARRGRWDTGRLTPLLAGLLEIMPWVRQWHSDIDPAYGQSPAEAYDAYLTSERESRNLTEDALRAWRAPQPQRGRRLRS